MCVCVCSKMWAVLFPLLQLNYPIKSTDLFDSVLQLKEGAKKALTPGHLDRMGDGSKVRMWGSDGFPRPQQNVLKFDFRCRNQHVF